MLGGLAWVALLAGCATTHPAFVAGTRGVYPVDRQSVRTDTAKDSRVRFLVMHYTAADFARSATLLTQGPASADYLVPDPADPSYGEAGFKQLRVFNLVDEQERAWHAGVSQWENRTNLNDNSLGIEIVNQASETDGVFQFPDYAPQQIDAVGALARDILSRYPAITPTRVVGHSDIAYARKSDPGPRFPWHELYLKGVGAWYDPAVVQRYQTQFARSGLPSMAQLLAAFKHYGYGVPDAADANGLKLLVRAFQMHFRPSNYSGEMDVETAAILYALNDRYRS